MEILAQNQVFVLKTSSGVLLWLEINLLQGMCLFFTEGWDLTVAKA